MSYQPTVLLVEDEVKTANALRQGLKENDFAVEVAYDGRTGRALLLSNTYDIVLLDVTLPHISGLELCRELRIRHPHTPVIMLTALGEVEDKVSAFDIGADDYLVKPFDFRELLVRIQACLKRTAKQQAPTESGIIQIADMKIDTQGKTVVRGEKQIVLTAKEFALLEFLARNQGKVISKPEIAEKVWDITFDTGTNVVEVYVNFLRKKIDKEFEPKLIHTRSGMGYVLRVDE